MKKVPTERRRIKGQFWPINPFEDIFNEQKKYKTTGNLSGSGYPQFQSAPTQSKTSWATVFLHSTQDFYFYFLKIFSPLFNNASRVQSQANSPNSQASRTTSIKYVATTLHSYTMSSFSPKLCANPRISCS